MSERGTNAESDNQKPLSSEPQMPGDLTLPSHASIPSTVRLPSERQSILYVEEPDNASSRTSNLIGFFPHQFSLLVDLTSEHDWAPSDTDNRFMTSPDYFLAGQLDSAIVTQAEPVSAEPSGRLDSNSTHISAATTLVSRRRNISTKNWHRVEAKLLDKKQTKAKIILTAISASGLAVAILSKKIFWVFSPEAFSLICSGSLETKGTYKYATSKRDPQLQFPIQSKFDVPSFSCTALSDHHLAIGAGGKIMVFAVNGDYTGRWLIKDDVVDASILKLAFSSSGKRLVALLSFHGVAPRDEAWIYSTEEFQRGDGRFPLSTVTPLAEVRWTRDYSRLPSDVAFSWDETMVAICTTLSKGNAQIRLLKKGLNSDWRVWGIRDVPVGPGRYRGSYGLGLSGISLYVPLVQG